jgi:hypothetical protein
MNGPARIALFLAMAATPAGIARADGLSGSPSSMVHQHQIAVEEDYSFLRTPRELQLLASAGKLVPVHDDENLVLNKVSYPYTRPEVRDFVERFAAQYRAATGSRLVVTSLTRPTSTQPSNAHKLSVHPAGMAVDLRVPSDSAQRAYLERSLLAMERDGVLDVTRERTPAHYHVAVFAGAFAKYAAREDSLAAIDNALAAARRDSAAAAAAVAVADAPVPAHDGPLPDILLGMLALVAVMAPVAYRMWSIGKAA